MSTIPPTASRTRPRVAALDTLRGLCILLVLLSHFATQRLGALFELTYLPGEGTGCSSSEREAHGSLLGDIDLLHAVRSGRELRVTGWASSTRGRRISSIEIAIGDAPDRPATMGLLRDDVAHKHPELPPGCGFESIQEAAAGEQVTIRALVHQEHGPTVTLTRAFSLPAGQAPSARHSMRWDLLAGQWGVDGFFIISGYLICGILLRTATTADGLQRFYARRMLRIMPLALVLVAFTAWHHPASRPQLWSCVLFLANQVGDLGSLGCAFVMWSLALEEQLYAGLPIVIRLAPRQRLWLVVEAAMLLLIATRLLLVHPPPDFAYLSETDTLVRALPLALGCWIALLEAGLVPRPATQVLGAGLWTALVGLAGGTPCVGDLPFLVGFAALVHAVTAPTACVTRPTPAPAHAGGSPTPAHAGGSPAWATGSPAPGAAALRGLPEQALRHLGQRCYGIYLNHVALLEVLDLHLGFLPDRQLAPLWMGLVLVVAEVTYRGLEAPLLALAPSSLAPPPEGAG